MSIEYTHCALCAHPDEHELGCPASPTFGRAQVVALVDYGRGRLAAWENFVVKRTAHLIRSRGVRLRLVT
jgi:hypothetical protein